MARTKRKKISFYEAVDGDGNRLSELQLAQLAVTLDAMETKDAFHQPEASGRPPMHAVAFRESTDLPAMMSVSNIRAVGAIATYDSTDHKYENLPLRDSQGQAETTHVGLFDRNVLAIMRNGTGSPSPRHIEQYIDATFNLGGDEVSYVRLVPLAPRDRIMTLQRRIAQTRAVEIKMPASDYSKVPDEAKLVRSHLRDAHETLGSIVVGITWQLDWRHSTEGGDIAWQELQAVATSDAEAKKLEITFEDADTERGASVDLLNDIVAHSVSIAVEQEEIEGDAGRILVDRVTTTGARRAMADARSLANADIETALGG